MFILALWIVIITHEVLGTKDWNLNTLIIRRGGVVLDVRGLVALESYNRPVSIFIKVKKPKIQK